MNTDECLFPCDDPVRAPELPRSFVIELNGMDAAYVLGAIAERGCTEADFCREALLNHA